MRIYSPNSPLISLHIPKCAGQSFRKVLEQWFRERFFIHYYQQHKSLPPRHPLKPGICIHGHFNRTKGLGVMDYYPEIEQFITILRDPLEAAVSNYFFWKANARASQLKNGIITQGGEHDYRNIDDFFRKRPRSNMIDFMPREMARENYIEIIETQFIWIGLVDNLQTHVEALALLLEVSPAPVERVNISTHDEELSEALRWNFYKNNPLEFEIYRYVKNKLMEKE